VSYAPAGTTTQSPGIAPMNNVTYFARKGLDRLMPMLYFTQVGNPQSLPMKSGRTIQWFRRGLPPADVTPKADGYIPNPIPQTANTLTSTVEEYGDFMSSSTLWDETNIDDAEANGMIDDLSYQASISADTIARLEVDSNTGSMVDTLGATLSAADFKAQTSIMKGINVRPYANGDFMSVTHPYVIYDLVSDNTAGGFIDATKYQNGTAVLNGEIGKIGGCRIMESTNVGNDGGAAPNTKYYTYIFGNGAFGLVDLAGRGPSKITDPLNQRFNLWVGKGGPTGWDPTGTIGTYVSYRFVFAAKTFDPNRLKIVKADASLV
jgi:N4-gp56 family major capsid protein